MDWAQEELELEAQVHDPAVALRGLALEGAASMQYLQDSTDDVTLTAEPALSATLVGDTNTITMHSTFLAGTLAQQVYHVDAAGVVGWTPDPVPKEKIADDTGVITQDRLCLRGVQLEGFNPTGLFKEDEE